MNNKFLIAFDMDGTLLIDKVKEIAPETVNYLRSLTQQGHIIVLASGRPESELIHYRQVLGLTSPMACFNGIYTTNPDDKNFPTLDLRFPKQYALDLAERFIENGIWDNAFCETHEKIWLYKEHKQMMDFMWPHGIKRKLILGKFKDTLDEDPMTLIFFKTNPVEDFANLKAAVEAMPNGVIRPWFGHDIGEISFINFGKADALEYIRKYYDIPHDHTIAFGDYLNDIEMIKWAGHGVAMKNGCDEIKKVADYITEEDNNHNGIIATLKSIIENN